MRFGVRGHDVPASDPVDLCKKLNAMGIRELQLVAHKSFPDFCYSEDSVRQLAAVFSEYNIHIAIYGCYIDPLSEEGQARFLEHIRYAAMLGADVIATETAEYNTHQQEDEEAYQRLVSVFRCFVSEAEKAGVRIAVETAYAHPICTPEKTLRLLQDVASDSLSVILDPMNLMHFENDPLAPEYTRKAIALYGDRIMAVHWKEQELNTSHPAFLFAKSSENTVFITEGLAPEDIQKIKRQGE